MNEIQKKSLEYIKKRDNLLVVIPTGEGKTAIGYLAIDDSLKDGKKSVMIIPMKSASAEKYNELKNYFSEDIVIIDDGDNRKNVNDYKKKWYISVMTNERLDSILRDQNKRYVLNGLDTIIVDEFHIFGSERGDTLESTIFKLRIFFPKIRIIALSATIKNFSEFSYMNFKVLHMPESSRKYPIIRKLIKIEDKGYYNNYKKKIELSKEIINLHKGFKVIIFVTSRARTVSVLKDIYNIKIKNPTLDFFIDNYKAAFHNGGQSKKVRRRVEKLLLDGELDIICCTPTLAFSVNFPIDVGILFDLTEYKALTGSSIIDHNRIHQTIGRVARPQYKQGSDYCGYFYLLCEDNIYDIVKEKIKEPAVIKSQIKKYLLEKVLEWVVSGALENELDIGEIPNYLPTVSKEDIYLELNLLRSYGFVYKKDSNYYPTFKGRMTSIRFVNPRTVIYWEEVIKRRKDYIRFNYYNEVPLKELFILIASAKEYTDISIVRSEDSNKLKIAKKELGLYSFLIDDINIFNRVCKIYFYTFLNEIKKKYDISKERLYFSEGDVYEIKKASKRFFSFAKIIFKDLKDKFESIRIGSKYGYMNPEITKLVKLGGMGEVRLGRLLNKGIDSIDKLKKLDVKEISEILECTVKQTENILKSVW